MNQDYSTTDQQDISKALEIVNQLDEAVLFKKSVKYDNSGLYFMIRERFNKYLIVVSEQHYKKNVEFTGRQFVIDSYSILKCELNSKNAEALRSKFDFTKPVLVGKTNSYGFGDRIGNAGPAHLRAVRNTGFKPVLAQQSIRELDRTNRTAQEVMDAATWAVFQEGYTDGFGADADHLKTTDDIDRMVDAGFTMFTIDPSDYVVNEALIMDLARLEKTYYKLPWDDLKSDPMELMDRYSGKTISLSNGTSLKPAEMDIYKGMVKYGNVINHTCKMTGYLKNSYPDHPAEFELSVDETDQPTTPFEHFLIASELNRLGVELVSLAPRFYGEFEKGIDFKGDLDEFKKEYEQHLAIAERFGGYKMSIHSGSDKFSVYKVIGSLKSGAVHVKTAGTSYLEALRTIAQAKPELFRDILAFSLKRFEEDRKTYHISADLKKIPVPASLRDEQLAYLLDDNHTRQVLHVAYGSVLSGSEPQAESFKEELMETLNKNENLYENNLLIHFRKHLDPFK
ncbi:MAG: tagaturonate epimerase family protein [Balneolaceae bacterium]